MQANNKSGLDNGIKVLEMEIERSGPILRNLLDLDGHGSGEFHKRILSLTETIG